MKKLITLLVALISAFTCVFAAGCGDENEPKIYDDLITPPASEETASVSVYAPDGAPALAIAKFINDNETFGTKKTFDYHVVAATEINNAVISEKADMVIMPVNDATKIYKKADNGVDDYVMAAVITHGNFYVMSKSEIATVNDLIGKVVYVPMRGKVPDLTFQAALKINNIEYVESDTAVSGKVAIKYYNQPNEYLPLLKQNVSAIGLVPEPAATNANANLRINYVLDLQEMYDGETKAYPQAVLMVKKSLVQDYPALTAEIAVAMTDGVNWVKDNVATAVETIKGKFSASTLNAATLTPSAINNCKIYFQGSMTAKDQVKNYIAKIREVDENSASTVGDEFFL